MKNATSAAYFLLIFLSSCSGFQKKISLNDTKVPNSEKEAVAFDEQQVYDSMVRVVDLGKNLEEASSLQYEDGGSNLSMVKAWLDKSNNVVKLSLEESANDGKMMTTDFFFNGKELYFARQFIYDYQKEKNGFGLIYSYFGTHKKVIYTAQKLADNEDDLRSAEAVRAMKTGFDPSKALNIINQKGAYETRYQGHMETDNYKFIIVGTSGKKGQKSAIAYNSNFPLAEKLVKNNQAYLNYKLRVEFTKVTEMNNFSYQGLTGIKLIHEN